MDGCHVTELDATATFHKFPRNSCLKKRWEAVVPLRENSADVPIVCNSHFLDSDYRTCRGKKILYIDSIPSVFPPRLTDEVAVNGESGQEKDEGEVEEHRTSRKRRRKTVVHKNKRDSSTDSDTSSFSGLSKKCKRNEKYVNELVNGDKEEKKEDNDAQVAEAANGVESELINMNMDLEATIPSFLILDVHQKIKNRESNPISFNEHPEPVVPVDTELNVEKLEVSIDPSLLMMNEPVIEASIDLSQHDNTPERDKTPVAVIELVTSDEDDVILQEPKYDLIEVSDETDEENVPLVTIKNKHKTKHKEFAFKYCCTLCTFKTNDINQHYLHFRTHPDVVSSCPFCDFVSSDAKEFREHVVSHEADDAEVKCHLCPYVSKTVSVLLYHLDNHIQLKCEFCKYVTIDKGILSKHEKMHRKRYKCRVCQKSYSTKSSRNKHMLKHFDN